MRLDKYLTHMGSGSRSVVKKDIKAGMVTVDGAVVKDAQFDVKENSVVTYKGKEISYSEYSYIILNKPAGYVTALRDNLNKTVMELIKGDIPKDLTPVGRLDKDTEGLLLFTNDGELNHNLLSPKHHVDKCYLARVEGRVSDEDVETLKSPINIGTEDEVEMTLPAKLEIVSSGDISEVKLTICEGKYHQVKRMMAKLGKPVIYLKRLSFGSLVLNEEELPSGAFRELDEEEIKALKLCNK